MTKRTQTQRGRTQRVVEPGIYEDLRRNSDGSYLRGARFFFEQRVRGRTRPVKRYSPIADECRKARNRFLHDTETGKVVMQRQRITLEAFAGGPWREKVEAEKAPSTLRCYRSVLRCHVLPALGGEFLYALTAERIESALLAMRKSAEAGPTSCLKAYNLLSSIFRLAVKRKLVEVDPMDRVDRPRYDKPEKSVMQPAEYKAVVEAFDPWWFPLLILVVETNARIAELLSIQWRDVEIEDGRLIMLGLLRGLDGSPKSPKHRRSFGATPGLSWAVEVLRKQFAHVIGRGPRPTDVLFCWPPDDEADGTAVQVDPALDRDRIRAEVLYAALERAGIERQPRQHGWTWFRHTTITSLLRRFDVKTTQALSGHASAKHVLDTYGYLDAAVKGDAAQQHSKRFSGPILDRATAQERP